MLPIKLTYLSSDGGLSHSPVWLSTTKKPEITDVVVLYSMFYLEHQGVFISGYSQMKSNASVNDDRAAVNPGRSLKGFLK